MEKYIKVNEIGEKEIVYAAEVYYKNSSGIEIENIIAIDSNGEPQVFDPDIFFSEYKEYNEDNLECQPEEIDTDELIATHRSSDNNWSSEGMYEDDSYQNAEISEDSKLNNDEQNQESELSDGNKEISLSPQWGTIARTVFLIISLFLSIGYQTGRLTYEIDENKLYELIITIMTIISSVICWWKNNSFTKEAIQADAIMRISKETKSSKESNKANG